MSDTTKPTPRAAVERLRKPLAAWINAVEAAVRCDACLARHAFCDKHGAAMGIAEIDARVALAATTDLAPDDAPCPDPTAHEPAQSVTVVSGDPRIADSAVATRTSAATPDDADALRAQLDRALDLVRLQRHELHDAGAITDDEFKAIVCDPKAPERRARLETQDDLRAENERLRARIAELETKSADF